MEVRGCACCHVCSSKCPEYYSHVCSSKCPEYYTYRVCDKCSQPTPYLYLVEGEGELCKDCLQETFPKMKAPRKCSVCNEESDELFDVDQEYVCEDCLTDYFQRKED